VLGVRPVKPGYKTWLIEPQIGDLTWAAGTAPTPYGPIAVAWQKTSKGFRLDINVPAETSGTVGVPTPSDSEAVTDNGQSIEKNEKMTAASVSDDSAGSRPGYVYFSDLGPGAHVIQVTGGKK
jgi:alpha-L-rhamnosidase